MKEKIKNFLKRNLYIFTMLLSLLLPDVVLRITSGSYYIEALRGVPTLFTVLWVAFFALLFTGFVSRKWGRALYLGVASLFAVFMVSGYVYFRIFNQFFWLDNIGMTGQAMDYSGYILGLVDWKLILCAALEVFLIVCTFRFWKRDKFAPSGLWLLVPILGLVTLHTFMMTEAGSAAGPAEAELTHGKSVYRSFTDTGRSMHTAGAYQYVFRNVLRMTFPEKELTAETADIAAAYFAENTPSAENDMTGLFEGKNVIMVMMESLDDWMIREDYTPTICRMMREGLDFTNHFASTFGTGYTFNTEFTVNTGYHAMAAGTPPSELSKNAYPYSLANQFRKKGYETRSFHFNTPDFYNRGDMHAAFGYEEYVSYQTYMTERDAQCDATAIQNEKLYEKMVPEGDTPFFDYIITYSAHLPYTYADTKLAKIRAKYPELINPRMDAEVNNALLLAHDTDEFFRILLEKLEADGELENTVIIAFSDHFAYGLSSWEKLYALSDAKNPNMLEKTPFFIYAKDLSGTKIQKVTNTLDILPTVVNLFGLEKTPYWIGKDIFDAAYPGYTYFSSGAWYDGELHYFVEEDIAKYHPARVDYVEEMNEMFYRRERVNEIVLRTDYFKEKE